eukprot:170521_1
MITFTLILISLLSSNGTFGCIMPQSGQQYRIIIAGVVIPTASQYNRFILNTDLVKNVNLRNVDDHSGAQRWLLNKMCDPVTGSEYWHIASVAKNDKLLSIADNNINVELIEKDTIDSSKQRWRIVSYSENDDQWCQIERVEDGGRQYMCVPESGQRVTTCHGAETKPMPRRWFFQSLDFPVTCDDTIAPVLSGVPPHIEVNCDSIPSSDTPICIDNLNECVDPELSETRYDGTDCEHSYILDRVWTCTDSCGNKSPPQTQTIRVEDTTPPVLNGVPANIEVNCDEIPAPGTPICIDKCDDDIDAILSENRYDGNCKNSYILDRTWTCTDSCGNKSPPQTQTITVVDTTPPVLNGVPANIEVNCDEIPAPATPICTDNCDDDIDAILSSENKEDGICEHSYILHRAWICIDSCGNKSPPQ